MPKPTKYWYWQIRPYRPEYYAFLHFSDMTHRGAGSRIATVARIGFHKWAAFNSTDADTTGAGETRDQAVDDLLEQIGGLG
jgi:hypothetical protein